MAPNPKTKFKAPGKTEQKQDYPGSEADMVTKPDYGETSYKGSNKLAGKAALITGGDSGIGRAVAVAFAKEGADVVLAYLPQEEEDAQETKRIVEASGRHAALAPGDLIDASYCEQLVVRTIAEFGKIDILVNNAGLQKYFKTLDEIEAGDFEQIYRINVIAPFILIRAAASQMKPGSTIVNTVSVEAYEPDFVLLPYAVSKGAFVALTKGLSEELIKKGIRVNAVAPGPIWTPLNTHGSPEEKMKKFGENTAFGRPGQPVELAPTYVLLASDDSSYTTGEIYGITGGAGIA